MKLRPRLPALVWALGLVASSAAAQTPTLVKTLNLMGKGPSNPSGFVAAAGTTFFTANDGVHGVELWKTDGTAVGTVLVKDINPGSGDSTPQNLVAAGSLLFFTATDGVNGVELWKSNGTDVGTQMVMDIDSGGNGSEPSGLVEYTVAPGTIFFAADNGLNGRELWKSNGTTTTLVADVEPFGSSNPRSLVNFGGFIYFAADSTDAVFPNTYRGIELWRTDGTTTTMVADINTTTNSNADVDNLTVAGPNLFFTATDGPQDLLALPPTHGYELWKWDGVAATLVQDIRTLGSGDSDPANLTAVGSTLFFSARNDANGFELWKTNGTTTAIVADLNPLTASSNPSNLTVVGTTLFFTADNGTNGREVFKTDGSTIGLVQDIVAGAGTSNPQYLVNLNGTLLFSAAGGAGAELWKSPGTGATQVANINPFGDSLPTGIKAIGSIAYFSADDGTHGAELWQSNGTTATLVKDINSTSDGAISGAVHMGEDAFFAADDGTNGVELWKSDGSNGGTVLVANINVTGGVGASSNPTNLTVVKLGGVTDTLFFAANDGTHGNELWKSDGVTATLVKDINTAGASDPHNLVDVNGTLFFAATDANGIELWKSNGTGAGTVLVKNINTTAGASSSPHFLTNVNGVLYFAADDGTTGNELWKSDGTDLGTARVADIRTGSTGSEPSFLANLNGTVYFAANDGLGTIGNELWKYDGATLASLDIRTGPSSSNPQNLLTIGDSLYFSADDGSGVWLCKIGPSGTFEKLKSVSSSTHPQAFTDVGGKLFFVEANSSGTSLWTSDGTVTGTDEVMAFNPAVTPSAQSLANVFGTLYFAADDAIHGMELWKSNGTALGTVLVTDIITGTGSSSPAQLATFPGGLLFAATDSVNGRQLWGIVGADLGVEQSASPNPIALDGVTPVVLTATVTNHGHVQATGVVLTETLTSVTFGSGAWTSTSPAASGTCSGSPVTCSIGALDPGAVAVVTITVTPTAVGSFAETATAATATTDLNPGNNTTVTSLGVWPLLSIADKTVTEGDLDPITSALTLQDMAFTVTLSNPSLNIVTVNYATTPVTATAGAAAGAGIDYVTKSGTLTFQPGATTQTFNVQIVGDNLPEGDKTFNVTLSAPAFAFTTPPPLGRPLAVGTIKDNDSYQISISDVTIMEGDNGTSDAVFNVTMTGTLTSNSIILDYFTANGTALAPGDYAFTASTGTPGGTLPPLVFPTNPLTQSTTKTITVPIVGDLVNEDDENFFLNISVDAASPLKDGVGGNVILADKQGKCTIQNNDPPPVASINDVTVVEGNSGTTSATFNVSLNVASAKAVTVAYITGDGTATAGADYTAKSGNLTFAPGVTSQLVTVPVVGDTTHEADETFFVNISSPDLARVTIGKNQGVGTIQDDDYQISIDNVPAAVEGDALGTTTDAVFTVTLTGTLHGANLQVKYATAPGTATAGATTDAPADYVSQNGVLTFTPGGPLTQTINVPVVGDTLDEDDETFFVNLTKDPASPVPAGNVTLVDAQGVGTIKDDDPPPAVSINDAAPVQEGNAGTTNATFTATLSTASARTIKVDYTTALTAGSAIAGTTTAAPADYLTRTGTLTFPPNTTTLPILVPVVGDTRDDLDQETFFVDLQNPVNATLGAKHQGQGTIVDDDGPAITINNVAVVEGAGGTTTPALFSVSLSIAPANVVTVDYATNDVTATSAAGPLQDYLPTSGTLTFHPGDPLTQTISVTVVGDDLSEGNDTFVVNLSNAVNAAVVQPQGGTGTITNDDTLPTLSVDDVAVLEKTGVGNVVATFHFTLSKIAGQAVTVNYATANGTAVGGANAVPPTDYVTRAGTLTFPQGGTALTIDVPIVSDGVVEANKIFYLNLTAPNGATLLKPKGQGTIMDDDAGGHEEFALPTFSVAESAATALITVKRLGSVAGTVKVDYKTSDGSAVAGQDYTARVGTLTFTPNITTRTFTVPILKDTAKEGDETFLVTLSNPTGGSVLGAQATAAVTIVDDDASIFSFALAKYATAEGKPATKILVRRTGVITNAATVAFAVTGGTATLNSDYAVGIGGTGTLSFAPRVTSQTFDFVPIDDTEAAEAPETAILSLTNPQSGDPLVGAKIGTLPSTTVTITDNEPTIQFSVTKLTVKEPVTTAMATLIVKRSSGVGTSTVDYSLGGTATPGAGADYLPPSSGSGTWPLTFLPGVLQVSIPFTILPDDQGELPETIVATLSNPTSASLGANQVATVTITDNEPTVQFVLAAYTAAESAGTTNLMVKRSSGVGEVTVNYAVSGGTATPVDDYSLGGTGTLTFAPGVLSMMIPVSIVQDALPEGNETAEVTLSNPVHATLGTPATTVLTITDDDTPTLFFSAPNYPTTEAAHTVVVTVKRSGPLTGAPSVFYQVSATDPGTATGGADYTLGTGFLTFLPNQAFKTFNVTILNDTIPEPAETINLELFSPTGAGLGTQKTATVTIADNDLPGTFSFSAPTYSVGEAGPTAKITVKRTGGMASNVAVHYAASNGTATVGQDYAPTSGELFFGLNVTSMTFEVPITDDPEDEGDETVNLTLTPFAVAGQAPAIIGLGSATLTIVDNDTIGAFSFATPSFSVREGDGVATITVTRSGAASGNTGPTSSVTVHYKTTANTATAGDDYTETEGDLTFDPGVTSMTFTIPITDDIDHEGNETVDLELSAPTGGATLGALSEATLWIVDND